MRVVANKRFEWINSQNYKDVYIAMSKYTVNVQDGYVLEGVQVPTEPGSLTSVYGLGDATPYNECNFTLKLGYSKYASHTESDRLNRQEIEKVDKCNDIRHLYYYDASKYQLKVITSNIDLITSGYPLATYFADKKLFKVLDMFLETVRVTGTDGRSYTANVKIYYLEKK